ncbi:MAG: FKBP-type peptidyl-prolyl cis-trans isomerase [Chitinophagaceae bacterium]
MKRTHYLWIAIAALAISACNGVNYQKTKSGLLYKIISSSSKDSVARVGDWIKVNYVQKIDDSVLMSSFGKMPAFQKVAEPNADYTPNEIFGMLRKGDSAVTVILIDSIIKKGLATAETLPPYMKKGSRLTISFRVVDVFRNDSTYQADFKAEMDRDMPRQQKEQAEQMAKQQKEAEEARRKEEEELEKSGEKAKQIGALESYFKAKNITVKQVAPGTYVQMIRQGNGPVADSGKFVTINYNGKHFDTDSSFQASSFTPQLYVSPLIAGFQDGLKGMKEGDKGTIYIAGFRAYGKNPPQGSPFKPYEALKFEVEITKVSDTAPEQPQQ